MATFRRVVDGLSAEALLAPHPEARFGTVMNTLVHLVAHFALHRGQMSYLVRLCKPGLQSLLNVPAAAAHFSFMNRSPCV